MKKLVSIVLTVGLLIGSLSVVASAEPIKADQLMTKVAFAESLSSKYKPGFTNSPEDLARYEYISKYLAGNTIHSELTTLSSKSNKLTLAEEKLNSLGFYVYSYNKPTIVPTSDGGDIKINDVIIMYDSYNDSWVVGGGGYWRNTSWQDDSFLSGFWGMPWAGATQNIGGHDGIGVALYNTSGQKPRLISSYAYVHDGNGQEEYYYNPMNLDTSIGVFFDFQDYLYLKDSYVVWGNITYMGYGFSATAIYDSSFANYNGRARTYYAHTWDSTNITDVGITNSGFNIGFSHDKSKFAIYQTGETIF